MGDTGNRATGVDEQNEKIDSRCIVRFRPDDNWGGEYGFDWFREGNGDIQEWIDGTKTSSNYNDIVGKYRTDDPDSPNYDPYYERFIPIKSNIDYRTKLGDSYGTTQILKHNISTAPKKYYYPVIHLFYMSSNPWNSDDEKNPPMIMRPSRKRNTIYSFCTTTATIKLLIHAQNINRIELEFDKCITVSNSRFPYTQKNKNKNIIISPISNGESEREITVALKYDFKDAYKYIKAYAYHKDGVTKTFAGMLKIKRCIPKTIKICFVNVKYKLKNSGTVLYGLDNHILEEKKRMLCRYLSQACIIPTFKVVTMDLSENTHVLNRYWVQVNGEWVLNINGTDGKELPYRMMRLFNRIKDKDTGQEYSEKYKRYYKCFFFGTIGAFKKNNQYNTGLLGSAREIPSMECVLFKNRSKGSTTCHELLHCLGFYHSFNNLSEFTFEKEKTNNIMDYANTCYTLWHWQWDEISKKIK